MRESTKSTNLFWCVAYIYIIVFPSFLIAQTTKMDTLSIFQKLKQDSIFHITLEADFDYIFENKKKKGEYPATLNLLNLDNATHLPMLVKVKTRGVFRRQFCDIPPLRINFDKKVLDSLGLKKDFDKLKLVTHCVEDKQAEQVLYREYWAYKLYNQLTPNSFQVHLVKITYINSKDTTDRKERFGFLIENNHEMAHRLGGKLIEQYGTTDTQLTRETHQHCMLFNYMIGNLDWHIKRQRNIKLVQIPGQKELMLIPYDFDMSAFVFPSYARLNPDFGQRRFTDRFCVGRFNSKVTLETTIQQFKNLQPTFITALSLCPYLNDKSKKQMNNYLNSFYKPLSKKKFQQRALLN